jgi:hypothetical protein
MFETVSMQEMEKKYETENPHLCKICSKRFPTQVFMYRYGTLYEYG